MANTATSGGEVTKLTITPYKDIDFKDKRTEGKNGAIEPYKVMYNPSTIVIKLVIERDESQPNGQTAALLPFLRTKPQDYSFEFILDGTGANGETARNVSAEIDKFLDVVYDYKSDDHHPSYITILYGTILLKCVLKTLDITYNLFEPSGKPLRAKLTATFTSCASPELTVAKDKPSSPDLTHIRKFKVSDRLITKANAIYKKNTYYLEVARANDLDNFRNVPEGTSVFFYPLAKT